MRSAEYKAALKLCKQITAEIRRARANEKKAKLAVAQTQASFEEIDWVLLMRHWTYTYVQLLMAAPAGNA